MLQDLYSHISPQRQAHIFASGLLAILTLGTLALLFGCLVGLWLVIQVALFLMATIISSCSELTSVFTTADPLVKLFVLCALGLVAYKTARKVWRL